MKQKIKTDVRENDIWSSICQCVLHILETGTGKVDETICTKKQNSTLNTRKINLIYFLKFFLLLFCRKYNFPRQHFPAVWKQILRKSTGWNEGVDRRVIFVRLYQRGERTLKYSLWICKHVNSALWDLLCIGGTWRTVIKYCHLSPWLWRMHSKSLCSKKQFKWWMLWLGPLPVLDFGAN